MTEVKVKVHGNKISVSMELELRADLFPLNDLNVTVEADAHGSEAVAAANCVARFALTRFMAESLGISYKQADDLCQKPCMQMNKVIKSK